MARVPLSRPLGWDSRSPLRSLLCSMHFMGAPQPCTPPRPADIQGSLERAAPVQAAGVDWGSEWGLALLPKSGESLHRTPARAGLTPSKCRQAHRQGGGGGGSPSCSSSDQAQSLDLEAAGPKCRKLEKPDPARGGANNGKSPACVLSRQLWPHGDVLSHHHRATQQPGTERASDAGKVRAPKLYLKAFSISKGALKRSQHGKCWAFTHAYFILRIAFVLNYLQGREAVTVFCAVTHVCSPPAGLPQPQKGR